MLNRIQKFLEKEQLECSLHPAIDPAFLDRLLVWVGKDFKEREQIIEITSQEQPFHLTTPTSEHYYRIQFSYLFPFKVEDLAIPQVASLLLFLNQLLDFPGLELNELENQVAYRYVWLTSTKGLDSLLAVSLIGLIALILDLFTQSIERLADGSTTFNELLEEVIHLTQNLK